MAKTPRSRKAKGRRFEKEVAERYRTLGIDSTASPMPMSGAMEHHKGDIFKRHDNEWVDECKNQETVSVWAWWKQAVSQIRGHQKAVLHIKRNYETESLSIMKTEDYFQMRAELKQLREQLNIN